MHNSKPPTHPNRASLYTACILGDIPAIESALFAFPGSVNKRDPNLHWSPLFYSVVSGHHKPLQFLLESGANPDIGNNSGETPLDESVKRGYYHTAKLLLKYKANPNLQESDGFTPLFRAVVKADIHMIELLLKYRSDVNAPNGELKRTALHEAVGNDNEVVIMMLLNHLANPYQPDINMETPLDAARTKSTRIMIENFEAENYSETSWEFGIMEVTDTPRQALESVDSNKLSASGIQHGKFFY